MLLDIHLFYFYFWQIADQLLQVSRKLTIISPIVLSGLNDCNINSIKILGCTTLQERMLLINYSVININPKNFSSFHIVDSRVPSIF